MDSDGKTNDKHNIRIIQIPSSMGSQMCIVFRKVAMELVRLPFSISFFF